MASPEDNHELLIDRGRPTDAVELAKFAARTFDETFAIHNNPTDFEEYLQRSFGPEQQSRELSDPNIVTLLVRRNGELVAYAQVRRSQPPPCITEDAAIELHRIYVDRPAHGTGVASLLMQAVHEVVREFGGRHVWLGVWEHNPRAIAFYQKKGFVDVGNQPFMLGSERQEDRVMVAAVR